MIKKKIKLLIPKKEEKLYNIILKDLNDFEIESYEVDANGNCSFRIYAKTKSTIEPIEPPAIKLPPIPTGTKCL
jgi:hypothetical protein